MAQSYTQKTVNTFVKGLITEAGELTFPENASVDELNCDLLKDGSRRRRLSIAYESSYELSDYTVANTDVISTHTWKNVGGEANTEFFVVQIANKLYFYEKSSGSLSPNRVDTTYTSGTPYFLSLSSYNNPYGGGASSSRVEVTSINGAMVVASPDINTILVQRDTSDGSFTVEEIAFRVRDFEWIGDISTYYEDGEKPVSNERRYDTANCGWHGGDPVYGGGAALDAYTALVSGADAFPALTHPWHSGKDSSGVFDFNEWQKIYAGTSLTANGHFILDLFTKDRGEAFGVASEEYNSIEEGRFSTVASYAGRVFYSGIENSTENNNSKIYFSQLLYQGFDRIGDCFQENDPTSEIISDLLDTDGGEITIPEAYNIQKLHVFGPSLYVFAENGVWVISGVDDVFRATEYSVSKITDIGLPYKNSFVSALGRPYWWSSTGIHTLVAGEFNAITEQNISLSTIQSFWDDISAEAKDKVTGIYDSVANRVVWLYPDNDEATTNKLKNLLFFDESLSAFFPWSVEEDANGTYIAGSSFFGGTGVTDTQYTVVDSDGATVQDSLGNDVIVTKRGRDLSSSSIQYLVIDGFSTKSTFAEFTGTDFLDWGSVDYSSYAETGYNFMGDLTIKKNAPYLTAYFRVTETGWESDGGGGYQLVRPSSCKVSYIWDFKDEPSSKPQQAYKLKPTPVVDISDLNNNQYAFSTTQTRLKLRGRGQSMRVRFESEQGYDFHILGYEIIGAKNPRF